MPSLLSRILPKILKLFDLLVMLLSFSVATIAAHHQVRTVSFDQFLAMRITVQNFALFLGLLLVWHFIFVLLGLYSSGRLTSRRKRIFDETKATISVTLTLYAIALLFRIELVTPIFLAVFFAASTAIIILSRTILGYVLKLFRIQGQNLRHMLIVGTNSHAVQFAQKIEKNKGLGFHLIGFADNMWKGAGEFETTRYRLVTDLNNLAEFLSHNVVDDVVICLPMKPYSRQSSRIINICREQGIIVRFHLDVFIPELKQAKRELFDNETLITISPGAINDGLPFLMKRVLDFALSLILIIILSPLLFITALLIKLTSSGPVFFIQERVGLNKRRFPLYKFRTMVMNAEQKLSELEHLNEVCGPVFKIKDDPRITQVGKFLRKTSIDELPQLFNVLKGDMSLVGPRPLPVRDYKGFDQDWHRRRLSVRPGITCLWQINGRCSVPFEKWMELDMEYIDHWSLGLDFRILVKTLPAVLNGSGAR
jgi:exopolysaccharide biosynthesis polyprenyl glycosylphosphotransferase